jgi:hypothetical protein
MQVFVAFVIISFVVGHAGVGRRVRERPVLLLGFTTVVAASFYSLRVVL